MTNNTVLSGAVPLTVEFGSDDTNRFLEQVFLTDNDSDDNLPGTTFSDFPLANGVSPNGVWDTTQVTNGVYTLQLGAKLNDETAYLDTPISVTVSNVMWTPDPWKVGGQAIYVGVQTVFTSGTWRVDVYDDQNTHLGHLTGSIAADGYCNYPGIAGPGFSLDNTDGQGNQNPSTAYTLVMAVHPPSMPPPFPTLTNTVLIEPAWNFAPTYATTCYYQPFPSYKDGYAETRAMMEAIWNEEQAFHPNLLGNFNTPFEIQLLGDWITVVTNLANPASRDFIYFGHGSENILGVGTNISANTVAIDTRNIEIILHNTATDPLIGTNRHPYRFVYLDGCETADGRWPLVFGIPKQKGMVTTDFTNKRGIRPRAFFGWNRKKNFTDWFVTDLLDPDFQTWRDTFWKKWAERDNQGNPLRNIKQAATLADTNPNGSSNSAGGGRVIYGAEDLVIDY